MSRPNEMAMENFPAWVSLARAAYQGIAETYKNSKSEVGLWPNNERVAGTIYAQQSRTIRRAFFDFIPQVAGRLPDVIPLERTNIPQVINIRIPRDSGMYMVTTPSSLHYLPRRNEIYLYNYRSANYNESFDPNNPDFVGLKQLRKTSAKYSIYKADLADQKDELPTKEDWDRPQPPLTAAQLDIILGVAQRTLVDQKDIQSLQAFEQELANLRSERDQMIQRAATAYGTILQKFVDQIAGYVEDSSPLRRFIFRRIKKTDTIFDVREFNNTKREWESTSRYLFSYADRRLQIAPLSERRFLGLGRESLDIDKKKVVDAPISDWCWHGFAYTAVRKILSMNSSAYEIVICGSI